MKFPVYRAKRQGSLVLGSYKEETAGVPGSFTMSGYTEETGGAPKSYFMGADEPIWGTLHRPEGGCLIGDRIHYAPPQGGGPWHGVVIAHTAGVYTIEVVKPNGNHHVVVAALGTAPGEFVLVT